MNNVADEALSELVRDNVLISPPKLALLGPFGSGKRAVSGLICSKLRSLGADQCRCVHFDLASVSGFSIDEVHFKLTNEAFAALGSISTSSIVSQKDATILFPHRLASAIVEAGVPLVFFINNLDAVASFVIRAVGNSFRQLLERVEVDLVGLVWSGSVSLFEIRNNEHSALTMCRPLEFPRPAAEALVRRGGDRDDDLDLGSAFVEPFFERVSRSGTLDTAYLEELVSSAPAILHMALIYVCDTKMQNVFSRLKTGSQVGVEEPIADIHPFQVCGAFLVERHGHYPVFRVRNGVISDLFTAIDNLSSLNLGGLLGGHNRIGLRAFDRLANVVDVCRRLESCGELFEICDLLVRGFAAVFFGRSCELTVVCWSEQSDSVRWAFKPHTRSLKPHRFNSAETLGMVDRDFRSLSFQRALFAVSQDRLFVVASDVRQGLGVSVVVELKSAEWPRAPGEAELRPWAALVTRIAGPLLSQALQECARAALTDEWAPKPVGVNAGLHTKADNIVRECGLTLVGPSALLETGSRGPQPYSGNMEADLDRLSQFTLGLSEKISDLNAFRAAFGYLAEDTRRVLSSAFVGLDQAIDGLIDDSSLLFKHRMHELRFPLEILPSNGAYLGLRLPIRRQIIGFVHRGLRLHEEIQSIADGRALKVVLVGSGDLSRVDDELGTLTQQLARFAEVSAVHVDVAKLVGREANLGSLEAALKNGRVNVLHIASHGMHSSADPENSGIVLDGERDIVATRRLSSILRKSSVDFLFLNVCYGGSISAGRGFAGVSLSGILHAALNANVRSVVGHRWAVLDKSAMEFSRHMYNGIFEGKSLSDSLFAARWRLFEVDEHFAAWAAPILIESS